MTKTIQIDLKNSPNPNWRYVTGIYGSQNIGCSIYPNVKIGIDRLAECKKIFHKHDFRIVEA